MKKLIALNTLISFSTFAADTALPVKFGGFLDTYYAFDSNMPKDHEREYTTQPVRHNEFNVNLAYIDATLNQETTRGRLALQFGQSVAKNYSSEPQLGKTSGDDDSKNFQEAYVGKKIAPKTWIDAGIYLGNIGSESWISRENWTYTRALNLDYVPYYSAGVRLEHELSEKETIQVHLMNGWQIISENNNSKALGFQYKNLLSPSLTFTYNNFLGDEEVVPNPETNKFNPRFRTYHNFILKWMKNDLWHFLGSFDVGHQSQQNNSGVDAWYSTYLTIKRNLTPVDSISTRVGYYNDRHQANVSTSTLHGFEVIDISTNYDRKLDENALWRTEIRGFYSKDEIYPSGTHYKNRWDGFIVTSLSFWI